MPIFSKESLETLRQRIDLADVLTAHLDLKKSGAVYKGLCPFHDEKTPSFTLQKGDTHYHCFGCGAHGDAIQFLMNHLKMSFSGAVESLAQRFNVHLQQVEGDDAGKSVNKQALKEALDTANRFFHLYLLHTSQGHEALKYLYSRGIDLDFIKRFSLGLAPKEPGLLRKVLQAKFIKDEFIEEAGLVVKAHDGRWRDFFQDRITIPISDPLGATIGFSARKYKEETYGGKYINTAETPLFKKSRVVFGLNYCRRRIAKERKAIIVEGQIDALRLISLGFNIAIAGQGTAFGEGHVKELMALGITQVFLALDSDEAGRQATYKIGNFFQLEGVDVRVIMLPKGQDPDSFLKENGPDLFLEAMHTSVDYLKFIVDLFSEKINLDSPSGKNELVELITKQIRSWNHPLIVHESLRKVAHLVNVPESMLGVGQDYMPNIYIKKSAHIGLQTIDPDKILESDVLHGLLLMGQDYPNFIEIIKRNITPEDFHSPLCRHLYSVYLDCFQTKGVCDFISLAILLNDDEAQIFMSEILDKRKDKEKVSKEKGQEHFILAIQKMLDRNWMEETEKIKMRIQSAQCSEEELFVIIKQFNELRKAQPKVVPL